MIYEYLFIDKSTKPRPKNLSVRWKSIHKRNIFETIPAEPYEYLLFYQCFIVAVLNDNLPANKENVETLTAA